MLLVKLPDPVPLSVQLSDVVGLAEVLQHTPYTVTEGPPSDVTSPPLVAVLAVMADAPVVVTVGAPKVLSLP